MSTRITSLVVLLLTGAVSAQTQPALNQKILDYCARQRGKKVGDGECASLAVAALRAAGAKSHGDFTDNPGPGDYVWGKEVAVVTPGKALPADGAGPLPGDLVQFRDVEFKGKLYTASAAHHTAIVQRVGKDRRTITVLHQNWGDARTVTETTLELGDLRKGWLRFYRPLAAE